MATYTVDVFWNCYKSYQVQADSAEEARETAEKMAQGVHGGKCYQSPDGVEIGDIDEIFVNDRFED